MDGEMSLLLPSACVVRLHRRTTTVTQLFTTDYIALKRANRITNERNEIVTRIGDSTEVL